MLLVFVEDAAAGSTLTEPRLLSANVFQNTDLEFPLVTVGSFTCRNLIPVIVEAFFRFRFALMLTFTSYDSSVNIINVHGVILIKWQL